jgi:hypothetical protein
MGWFTIVAAATSSILIPVIVSLFRGPQQVADGSARQLLSLKGLDKVNW